jgi:hypothetical protein
VALDPEQLEADFLDVVRARARAAEALAGQPTFELTYEDLCRSYDDRCRAVQEFLGVSPILPLRPAMEKLPERPLAEAIANYDALRRRFAATPWAEFFDD